MRSLWILGLVVAVAFAAAGCDSEKQEVQKTQGTQLAPAQKSTAQTTCPVMGGKINKEVYVDYEGKRVYFCCPGCETKFMEDPETYIKQMEAEGVVLEQTPSGTSSEAY